MHVRTLLSTATILAISSCPWAATAASAPTLCKADERVVFSCPTGAHTISLCASQNISKSAGSMQYRFGKPGSIDLAYPDATAKPADVFATGMMMFSGGGGAWLRFSNRPFRYTIFTAIGKWGRDDRPATAEGVAVEKDGVPFANFPCRAAAESELGPDFFDKLGLKAADPAEDFDIPDAFMPK